MHMWLGLAGGILFFSGLLSAGEPALTVYNQQFAVVRDTVPLDLKAGVNQVRFCDTTMHLEPTSVLLRDPTAQHALQIWEQNFRADPVSQELLLSLYEGQTIDFQQTLQDGTIKTVKGKIVRSGYVPHTNAYNRYGRQYYQAQQDYAYNAGAGQPIIEVDGKLRFSLPGTPLFPTLTDDTVLKPTLTWALQTDKPGKFDAELSYITGGMSWSADYNVVAPEKGDDLDIVGWVTIDNQSGKAFANARIKLMAGDVSKLQDDGNLAQEYDRLRACAAPTSSVQPVSEKSFDEYHLYSLAKPTTLRDRETKQVEFVRAAGVKSERLYIYDGMRLDQNYRGWRLEDLRNRREYGSLCNPKVWVMREFMNSEANHLGIPLPKGKLRFYRRDDDGRLEFTGENLIDHTPKDEKVRVYTGDAFDLVGERRQTHFEVNTDKNWLDESFEIKLRNHKKEPVEIRVVEHLYRWFTWDIKKKSQDYTKLDARTIEFRVKLDPDQEATLTYTVHYWW